VLGSLRTLTILEIELFKEYRDTDPILLLDDFSSELDAQRREFLIDFLQGSASQVLLSTTDISSYDFINQERCLKYRIENGSLFETN
jgi:recombinational DNA repair ATPase RecF